MKTVYRAYNGVEFSTKEECQKYEDGFVPERLANAREMVKNRIRYLDQALTRYRGWKGRLISLMKRRNPASRKHINDLKEAVYATALAGEEYETRVRELAEARDVVYSILGDVGRPKRRS